jgi:sigma-B regulation protein RsbU (phosphoserine phosphatase)
MSASPIDLDTPRDPAELSDIRARVRSYAMDGGFTAAAADEVIVAVGEAVTNAIKHGGTTVGGGRIRLRCAWDGDTLVLTLQDYCEESKIGEVKSRNLDEVRPGGIGVHCMQQLMEAFDLIPDGDGWAALRLTRRRRTGRDEEGTTA